MKKLTANEVREMWLDFFKSKEHHFLAPVSLIPVDDASLLWINSGVATLKPYFDGRKTPPSQRLTNSQKSIRTNDIENVGVTARHQTMFEMLGNFSIGDYFKTEAIHFSWELLTSQEWFAMDKELLYITVFEEDVDAYNVWTKEIGIAEDHIFKGTRETNFWDVGQGPCGPNTEIFFDRGTKWDPENIGPKLLEEDIENDRYIEVWNIVFSQYNNDGNNNYTELPRKNIDTGAGLERIVSIFQETPTNFETDLFMPTIKSVENMCDSQFKYSIENYFNEDKKQTKINTAFKVIADHVRAASFAIADGVFPGNKDRGYIIRRLIRRSSVYGRKLGINQAFLYKLVDVVIESMGNFYYYLKDKRDIIVDAIKTEEEKFLKTLTRGFEQLDDIISKEKSVSGANALLLFESFGFPIELTQEIAEESNIQVDVKEFEDLFEQSKEVARNSRKDDKAWNKQSEVLTSLKVESEFVGYEVEECEANVIYMFADDKEIVSAKDQEVYVILDKTPFYAEKGGQAGDSGQLIKDGSATFNVLDTQQGPNHQHIHRVIVKNNELKVGDKVKALIDSEKRFYTMKNHSGTHILHAAIREVLGTTAMQAGSYNDENGLRMDITYPTAPTADQLEKINLAVQREIKVSTPREVIYTNIDDAVNNHGALAFFTEKYDEVVRIVKFGKFSCELCGGTHVLNTKDIEDLVITGIESKGSGLFRYHALTSNKTIANYLNEEFNKFKEEVSNLMSKYNQTKSLLPNNDLEKSYDEIFSLSMTKENLSVLKNKLNEFKEMYKQYNKQAEDIIARGNISKYLDLEPEMVDGMNLIKSDFKDLEMKDLKTLSDELQNKYKDVVLILFNTESKVLIVSVSESISNEFKAIDIFKNKTGFEVKGGGNPTFAQGKIL